MMNIFYYEETVSQGCGCCSGPEYSYALLITPLGEREVKEKISEYAKDSNKDFGLTMRNALGSIAEDNGVCYWQESTSDWICPDLFTGNVTEVFDLSKLKEKDIYSEETLTQVEQKREKERKRLEEERKKKQAAEAKKKVEALERKERTELARLQKKYKGEEC